MSTDLGAISHRIFDEVWNQKNLSIADEVIASGFVAHDPHGSSPRSGPEGYKEFVREYLAAFPDLHLTVEDQVCNETAVATRWTCTGTHNGPLFGIPPTGRRVTLSGIAYSRFENGKCTVTWNSWDALSLMQQLGVMPAKEEVQAA
jgi:steroid delta-isomerase-like uncharacterized protein